MPKYANQTEVSAERSRNEIEHTLRRYGAEKFMYGWQEDAAIIGFQINKMSVKFLLPMPDRNSDEVLFTPAKRQRRSPGQQEQAYEQAIKQRWRALNLCIKAKLEAVEAGIVSFDEEFLAHFILPGGDTVGKVWGEQIKQIQASGKLPPLITMG